MIPSDKNISKLENDRLFSALIATAVDGIVVIDAAGMVQVYNHACERLFGYSSDEVTGRNVKMLMPPPCARGVWPNRLKRAIQSDLLCLA